MKGKRGPRPDPHAKPVPGGPKPIKAGSAETKPNRGPAPKIRKPRKEKPAPPNSVETLVPRTLSKNDVDERARRVVRMDVDIEDLERRKREATRAISKEINEKKELRNKLAREVVNGIELLPQGDLFADGSTKESRVTDEQAASALTTIATKAGDAPAVDGPLTEERINVLAQGYVDLLNGSPGTAVGTLFRDYCADKGIRAGADRDNLKARVAEIRKAVDKHVEERLEDKVH